MFTNLLLWAVGIVLYVPFSLLHFVGDLLPECSTLQIVYLSQEAADAAMHWLEFAWPIMQYIPIQNIFNLFSAFLLYLFIRWLWHNLQWLIGIVIKFWYIIVLVYIIAVVLNVFTSSDWLDNSFFTDTLGENPTSTGYTGGGGGGGGGVSW